MIPFARNAQERTANGDPRPSLEERYKTHEGYVDAVRKAADKALRTGFLLKDDANRLVNEAAQSKVLQ
jgi:hypothetical protein